MITNCKKKEKVLCGCNPYFDSYQASTTSVLDVGNLVSASCTFDEYVIDWYRNGVLSDLVTGIGDDPDITTLHPFTGSSAIPVEGGTWVPVIRYVIVGGVKYYSTIRPCQKYCPDLELNVTIAAASLNCNTVYGGAGAGYNIRINYEVGQDYAQASRRVRFDLPTGATHLKYMAVYWYCQEVADQLDVILNGETISSWIVGTRNNTYQMSVMPYKYPAYNVQLIITIPDYADGDYLIFKVTPSVLEVNPNTRWYFDLKCLVTDDVLTACSKWYAQMRFYQLETFKMYPDPTNCRWVFEFKMEMGNNENYAPLSTYLSFLKCSHSSLLSADCTNGKYYGLFSYGRQGASQIVRFINNTPVSTSKITYQTWPSQGKVRITFDSSTDKQLYYNYFALIPSSFWSDFSSDPTNPNYYRYWSIYFRYAPSCGDQGSTIAFFCHASVTPTWGVDGNGKDYFEAISVPMTKGYVPIHACDSFVTTANTIVDQVNAFFSNNPVYVETYCSYSGPFSATKAYATDTNYQSISIFAGAVYELQKATPCGHPLFCFNSSFPSYGYHFMYFKFNVNITNYNDPANNYEVYTLINKDTGCAISATLIYKIVNGVRAFPV